MSAWAEYKAGLITDAEYNHICREEEFWDNHYREHPEELEEEDPDEFDENERQRSCTFLCLCLFIVLLFFQQKIR